MRRPGRFFDQDEGPPERPRRPTGPLFDQDEPADQVPRRRAWSAEDERRWERELDLRRERELERERRERRERARQRQKELEARRAGQVVRGTGRRAPNRRVADASGAVISTPARPGSGGESADEAGRRPRRRMSAGEAAPRSVAEDAAAVQAAAVQAAAVQGAILDEAAAAGRSSAVDEAARAGRSPAAGPIDAPSPAVAPEGWPAGWPVMGDLAHAGLPDQLVGPAPPGDPRRDDDQRADDDHGPEESGGRWAAGGRRPSGGGPPPGLTFRPLGPPPPPVSADRPVGVRGLPVGARVGGGSVGRDSAVMAAGTFLSRLTGFARVVLVATILGTNGLGDAYNLANSVPNIIYDLLVGGVLSATLVPVFVEQFRNDDPVAGDRAISAIVSAITVALVAISAALYGLAPLFLRFYLLLNHSTSRGAERTVGTDLLRLFAPQVLFLGAIVVSTALLNARRRFGAAAFSPVANNLIAIAALLVTREVATNLSVGAFAKEHRALLILGLGTTLGYLVQLLLQLPAMSRAGIQVRAVWQPRHPAVRRVATLSLWLLGVVIANQVSLTVILIYASSKTGDYTVYTTAYQFFQLPYALFTVSVASALTPDLAERWGSGDMVGFQRRMITGLRVTMSVLVPAAVGYAVIAQPLIEIAVRYGNATPAAAHAISSSLALFALGLPGFSAFVLLMRAYQAMQDTKTMFWMYALENALSLVLAISLYSTLGIKALAVAWVAPYSVAALVAAIRLQRRTGTLGGALTVRALFRIVLAGGVMALVLLGLGLVVPHGHGHVTEIVRLAVDLTVGTGVYVGVARALGIAEIEPVLRLIRRGR